MKLNKFILFSTLAIAAVFASCNFLDSNNNDVEYSDASHFISLSFARNDSSANVHTASFSVVYDVNNEFPYADSIIVNLDSLPYNTRVDSVGATFVFASTSSAKLFVYNDETSQYDSTFVSKPDTINFTKKIFVRNTSRNGERKSTYGIKVNVHKVEPELFVWQKLNNGVFAHNASTQKALLHDNRIFYYAGTGLFNYLYVSDNTSATSWTTKTLTGLPMGCDFSDMIVYKEKFYLLHDNNALYSSSNGSDWVAVNEIATQGFSVQQLLFVFENKLWAIAKDNNSSVFALRSFDGNANNTWSNAIVNVPETFPLNDFTTATFLSPTKKTKALVLGGTRNGAIMRNAWTTENGSYWVDFSLENASLGNVAGAAMLYYFDRLFMFGGISANGTVRSNNMIESIDEGFTWRTPDTTYNQIRELKNDLYRTYEPRFGQSAILINNNKEILLIGGRDNLNTYSDVWKGYVNKIFFKENE